MGDAGLNEFVKQYFPQIRKEGIIFDVRYNGGGFVDQLIFERLRRILAAMGSARNFEPGHGSGQCFLRIHGLRDQSLCRVRRRLLQLLSSSNTSWGRSLASGTWGGVRGIRGANAA